MAIQAPCLFTDVFLPEGCKKIEFIQWQIFRAIYTQQFYSIFVVNR